MKSYPFSQNQRPTLPPPFLSFSEDSLLWCFYVAMTFTSKRIQQVLLSLFKSSQGVGALFSLHPLSLSLSLSLFRWNRSICLSLSHTPSFCLFVYLDVPLFCIVSVFLLSPSVSIFYISLSCFIFYTSLSFSGYIVYLCVSLFCILSVFLLSPSASLFNISMSSFIFYTSLSINE